jgi:F-type H+-transporting ATPase subunit b
MQIDWWTLALQTINVLVLIWLLTRYLFRPVANMIAARQMTANALLNDAEDALATAENQKKQAQHELNDLLVHRKEALSATAVEADTLRQTLMNEAKMEAEAMRDQTRKAIISMHHKIDIETDARATELAVDIARRLLDRLPDSARVDGFIDGILTGIAELPEDVRSALGNDGHILRLTSARELNAEESKTVRSTLTSAIGHSAALEIAVDPGLIAGLELDGIHCSVHNSFRSDLATLMQTLTHDEIGAT